jgi:hypothetical protein
MANDGEALSLKGESKTLKKRLEKAAHGSQFDHEKHKQFHRT